MDEPVFESDQEKPHFERCRRAINAHLGFHRAYGSRPVVLAADAPGYLRLAALSEAVGLDFEPLLEDVLAMFGAPGADGGAQNAGTPPPNGALHSCGHG
jgi:hypothetical protein